MSESRDPVEASLRRLIASTSAPPSPDLPMDQLLAHAELVAKEREPVFCELSAMLAQGGRMSDLSRALVEQLRRSDRAWKEALDHARDRLLADKARLTTPTGRVSAYRR